MKHIFFVVFVCLVCVSCNDRTTEINKRTTPQHQKYNQDSIVDLILKLPEVQVYSKGLIERNRKIKIIPIEPVKINNVEYRLYVVKEDSTELSETNLSFGYNTENKTIYYYNGIKDEAIPLVKWRATRL